jgi:hypothetical protein
MNHGTEFEPVTKKCVRSGILHCGWNCYVALRYGKQEYYFSAIEPSWAVFYYVWPNNNEIRYSEELQTVRVSTCACDTVYVLKGLIRKTQGNVFLLSLIRLGLDTSYMRSRATAPLKVPKVKIFYPPVTAPKPT